MRKLTTADVRHRYDRLAPWYDLLEAPGESRVARWRDRLMSGVRGPDILEVGTGTGKNLPHYPAGLWIAATDLSFPMLARSREKPCPSPVARAIADVERLPFANERFDTILASFLLCSVADPVSAVREMGRVVRSDGRVLLLEHMRPESPLLGRLFDLANPLTRLLGEEINRRTVENVLAGGLRIEQEIHLLRDIVRILVCRR